MNPHAYVCTSDHKLKFEDKPAAAKPEAKAAAALFQTALEAGPANVMEVLRIPLFVTRIE